MAISLSESLHIGFADIWTRKVRSIVTIIGIVLGVMSIMVVLAIVNGMNKSTMKWMNERGGLTRIDVERNWSYDFSKGGKAEFSLREINYLREQVPELAAFNSTISKGNLELGRGENKSWADLQGVMPDMILVEDWLPEKGRFIKELDIQENNDVVVLGSTIAREIFGSRNPLGQLVTLSAETVSPDASGMLQSGMKAFQFEVIGVMKERQMDSMGGPFQGNMLEYLNKRAFIPLSTMINKVDPNQQISSLELKAKDTESAGALRRKVEELVLNLKGGKRLFSVVSANEQMQQMKQNSMIFSVIFVMIAVISLLVGGIVIMNIMLASIKERTREIGVRLAIGARRRDIFTQFLVQTVLITGLGGVFGVLAGYSILGMVGKYLGVEVAASAQMIWIALFVSVGVGLIFGILPAVRASNLDPVLALREE
ncbi:MAG: ABC transporter permease [Candidatus Cloacimonadota bacterium]